MGDKTKIVWTDATWNPVVGCTKVSPGCNHCYADAIATRFAGTDAYPNGFAVTLKAHKLHQPVKWTRGRKIFVNSMSDLFHDEVDTSYVAQVFAIMAACPQHTFQILTKRHARMRSLLTNPDFPDMVDAALSSFTMHGTITDKARAAAPSMEDGPLPNVWLGVSTEDQKWADIRIPYLLETPAALRFISAEPLLGPINLSPWIHLDQAEDGYPPLDWILVGGESGRSARRMDPEWARDLRDQCQGVVPFLFKQAGAVLGKEWGGVSARGYEPEDWPEPFPREFPMVAA